MDGRSDRTYVSRVELSDTPREQRFVVRVEGYTMSTNKCKVTPMPKARFDVPATYTIDGDPCTLDEFMRDNAKLGEVLKRCRALKPGQSVCIDQGAGGVFTFARLS